MTQNAFDTKTAGNNPFVSLGQLSAVITGIDSFLNKPGNVIEHDMHCRLVYLRNTLIVAFELWQNDIHTRIGRSRGKFYIFCMTDRERDGFLRRMAPGLSFAAEELRTLEVKALGHLVSIIDHCADLISEYANKNKACIQAGIENTGEMVWRNYTPLRRPHDPGKIAKGS